MIKLLRWMKQYWLLTCFLFLALLALPPVAAYYLCRADFYTLHISMEVWICYFAAFEVFLGAFYIGSTSLWQAEITKDQDILLRNTILFEKHQTAYQSTGNLFKPADATALKPYSEMTLQFSPQKECMPTGYILRKVNIKDSLNGKTMLSGKLEYAEQMVSVLFTNEQYLECRIKVVDEKLKGLDEALVLESRLTFLKEVDNRYVATDYEYTANIKFLGNTHAEISDVILHQTKNAYFYYGKSTGKRS